MRKRRSVQVFWIERLCPHFQQQGIAVFIFLQGKERCQQQNHGDQIVSLLRLPFCGGVSLILLDINLPDGSGLELLRESAPMAFKRSAVRSRLSPPSPEIVRFQGFFFASTPCLPLLAFLMEMPKAHPVKRHSLMRRMMNNIHFDE